MKNVSDVTGKTYSVESMVRIVNPKQAATYMANGIVPIDIYPSDCQSDKSLPPDYKLVFLFERNDKTREAFRLWCEHKLGRPGDNKEIKDTTKEN